MSFHPRKPRVERTERTDPILHLTQRYSGSIHESTKAYNRAAANVLRALADELEKVEDAWVCPEVVIWLHEHGIITAEVPLSPKADDTER